MYNQYMKKQVEHIINILTILEVGEELVVERKENEFILTIKEV